MLTFVDSCDRSIKETFKHKRELYKLILRGFKTENNLHIQVLVDKSCRFSKKNIDFKIL